ncbi:MAG: hypothetical protein ABW219_06730 [Ilumatobacteraceae bacterium]
MSATPFDHFDVAATSAIVLADRRSVERHDVAVVLGSGWGRCADALGSGASVPVAELPGFPAPSTVAPGVRVAAAAGCHTVVLTNGAGSLPRDWPIGQPVLIRDHLNLTGRSPLAGPHPPAPSAGGLGVLLRGILEALAR